jgi:large subunit ribosomal protein L18
MKRKEHNAKRAAWVARRGRVQRSLIGTSRARVTVFRSAKHIYAQLVDVNGRTLATASSLQEGVVDGYTGNVEAAKKVGAAIAAAAKKNQIEEVVFNRNGFLYHGRVKALAEAAREAGLKF